MADYQRLWNGTEPGWVVRRHIEDRVHLTLIFGSSGASMRDVHALRIAISKFNTQSAAETMSKIRGKPDYYLGDFESREARTIRQKCEKSGLEIREQVHQEINDLLVNEITNIALLIEDENLNRQVVQEALHHGLPTRISTA